MDSLFIIHIFPMILGSLATLYCYCYHRIHAAEHDYVIAPFYFPYISIVCIVIIVLAKLHQLYV
jgi:hypothetical protein